MLADVEAAPARLVSGTLELLLDAIEFPTAELLLSEVGTVTTGNIVLELDRTLDDATLLAEESTSCEVETTVPTVERGTASVVLLLEVPTILEAYADCERLLEVTTSADEEL